MDGYLYNRDPYREAAYAPVYQPSYALERRSSYVLHPSDSIASYSRVPIDPYAGYGAAASYQPEVVLPPRYASNPPPFRSRHRPSPKKRPPPAHNLGPKKKPFKQTQKVSFSEENGRNSKKPVQKKLLQNPKGVDKPDSKAVEESNFQVSSLVKETQELHSLYRTGVDHNTGKNSEESARKKDDRKARSTKRKAETQMQNSTPAKKIAKKKQKQKKKSSSKNKKSKKPARVEKVEPTPLTEEEKKEDEAGLELQRGMCESVSEFLGVPIVVEHPESKEVVEPLDESEADAKPEDGKEAHKSLKPEEPQQAEKPLKPEEPQLTPKEEKEIEEKSFKFFSKMFVEHKELRNLYIEKCNSGSFECLVCRSIEAKSSRRFWNLASLVMHTNMRKQMRFEHRGYGRSISAVLGWDPNKTPKVPRLTRLIPTTEKGTNQVKVDIKSDKSDMENKTVDKEENVADVNASDQHQDENAAEVPSKDSKEE